MSRDRPEHETNWYLDHVLADTERLASAVETGPLDAPIEACAGWDLGRLAEHLGQIHRWAKFCASNARPPNADDAPMEPFDRADAARWLRTGATSLVDTLRSIDPDSPTWHPFPSDQIGSFWPRRQAHETSVHRWDGQHAAGTPTPIDPVLASDGIDEYFEIVIPRLVVREGVELPSGSVHLHCTDIDGEWLVWTDDDGYHLVRAHQKGDAALRGPAEAILLRLWQRASADELSPIGDASVLDAWLDFGGA